MSESKMVTIQFETRRCDICHRWFGCEVGPLWLWRCHMCRNEENNQLRRELDKAKRANAALRGRLNRRGSK